MTTKNVTMTVSELIKKNLMADFVKGVGKNYKLYTSRKRKIKGIEKPVMTPFVTEIETTDELTQKIVDLEIPVTLTKKRKSSSKKIKLEEYAKKFYNKLSPEDKNKRTFEYFHITIKELLELAMFSEDKVVNLQHQRDPDGRPCTMKHMINEINNCTFNGHIVFSYLESNYNYLKSIGDKDSDIFLNLLVKNILFSCEDGSHRYTTMKMIYLNQDTIFKSEEEKERFFNEKLSIKMVFNFPNRGLIDLFKSINDGNTVNGSDRLYGTPTPLNYELVAFSENYSNVFKDKQFDYSTLFGKGSKVVKRKMYKFFLYSYSILTSDIVNDGDGALHQIRAVKFSDLDKFLNLGLRLSDFKKITDLIPTWVEYIKDAPNKSKIHIQTNLMYILYLLRNDKTLLNNKELVYSILNNEELLNMAQKSSVMRICFIKEIITGITKNN